MSTPQPPPPRHEPARSTAPLLEIAGLAKHYPVDAGSLFGRSKAVVRAVDGLSFALGRGETLALVGESGCGKSTTARLVLRLIEPTTGTVTFDGQDVTGLDKGSLRRLRARMQMVFQDPYASLNPRMTVAAILEEPLVVHGIGDRAARRARVAELLSLVGLAPFHAGRYPHEFSGGQRQRIGIARALAPSPALVVCDEPVSALDVSIQAQVVNLMKELQGRLGLSYLFIAHDLAVVKHMADRVAVMYLGQIVELAARTALFAAPRHPYTQALLAAIPTPDPSRRGGVVPLGGDVPSPIDPPSGCRFHTRCPHAQPRCSAEMPLLRRVGESEVACHFAESIPPPAPRIADQAASPVLMRRMAAYAARRDAA